MEFSRRLMVGAVVLPSVAVIGVLMGCKTTPGPTPVQSSIIADVSLIDGGIQALAPFLLAIPSLSPADVITVTRYVAAEHTAALAIEAITTAQIDSGTVGALATAVKTLGPIALKYLPAGSQYAFAMQAALSLLPIVLAAVGVVSAQAPVAMTAAQARIVLAKFK